MTRKGVEYVIKGVTRTHIHLYIDIQLVFISRIAERYCFKKWLV
jgi:hypothetical protein